MACIILLGLKTLQPVVPFSLVMFICLDLKFSHESNHDIKHDMMNVLGFFYVCILYVLEILNGTLRHILKGMLNYT